MKIKFIQNSAQKILPPSFDSVWLKNRDRHHEDQAPDLEHQDGIQLRNYDDFFIPF